MASVLGDEMFQGAKHVRIAAKGRLQSKECLEDLHVVLLVRPVSPVQPTNPKIGKKVQTARTRIRTLECFQLRQSEATGVR